MAAAKTAKAPAAVDHVAAIASAPAIAAMLPQARYMGVCVLQAPGGWTRVGPAWILPAGCGWAIYGPGVARWGTSAGLAQLASESSPTPSLHAVGLSVCPDPNIVYALTQGARPNKELAPVFEIEEALRGSPYVAGGAA